ncbi:MAG: response regulator transcription factor [Acidobacteria bacterium]|nr:response regulator transcription factor [Acidobacteriota bacterium]
MKPAESILRKLRFGIATDEPVSGTGLHNVLRGDDRFRVVWLPASVERLVQAVQFMSVDLMLIDMACGFPMSVDTQIRANGYMAPIILWMREDGMAHTGMREMAEHTVVLDKRGAPEMLLACVETVLSGRKWSDSQAMIPHMISEPQPSPIHVSPREAELMDLVAEGLSNRQIAERLQLTEGSVKVYFSRLFQKLGIPDRVGLALYSARRPWEGGVMRGPARGGAGSKAPPRRTPPTSS